MDTRIIGKAARALSIAAALTCASAAQATITIFETHLTGPQESPPNASPGTGDALVTIDDVAHTMTILMSFSGLTSPTTASHIHAATAVPFAGTAGVATQVPFFVGFPIGVTAGTFNNTFNTLDLATYNPAFVSSHGGTAASAEAALFAAMFAGEAYLNIHTQNFQSGEIRGFLVAVPEAATWMMMLVGFGAIGMAMRRRRSLGLTEAPSV